MLEEVHLGNMLNYIDTTSTSTSLSLSITLPVLTGINAQAQNAHTHTHAICIYNIICMIYVSMRLMEWIKVLSELVPSSLEALLCIYMLLSPGAGTDRTEAKRLHWRTRNEGLRCRKTPPSWWRLRAPPGHWAWPR